MIDRFANVSVPLPARYFAVKVLLPGVKPVARYVKLAWNEPELGAPTSARVSDVACVVAPETANDMYPKPLPPLPVYWAVTVTSALPEDGIVTVTAGPAVVMSP